MLRPTLVFGLLGCLSVSVLADDQPNEKTNSVKLEALTLEIPTSWKEAKNSSRMRLGTYEIPPAKEGGAKGELAVFSFGGGGGSVKDNLTRWVGQFESEGREVNVTRGKANQDDYYIANISGTYNKAIGPPIRRQTKSFPGYRMLGVILVLDEGVYFLKMTGEDETVSKQADALRAAFGGNKDGEEEYEL